MDNDMKISIEQFNEIFGKDYHKSNPEAFVLFLQANDLRREIRYLADKVHGIAINMDTAITSFKKHNGMD